MNQPSGQELNPFTNSRVKCTSPTNTAFKQGCQQNVLSIDWLEINYLYHTPDYEKYDGSEFIIGDQYRVLEVKEVGYPYRWRGRLYYQDYEVGSVQFGMVMEHADSGLFSMKFNNEILYSEYKEHLYRLNDLLEYKNIKRLDLALDTSVPVRKTISDLIFGAKTHELYDRRKRLNGVNYSFDSDTFGTIYIGSRSSDKSVAIYDKMAELEKSNKQYIRDNYKQAGDAELVDRVEIRLRSKAVKRYPEINDLALTNDQKVKELFVSTMDGYIDLKERSNDSNSRRWKTLKLIDLDTITSKQLEKAEAPAPSETYKAKIIAKQLYKDAQKCDSSRKSVYLDMAYEYVKKHGLEDWFDSIVEREVATEAITMEDIALRRDALKKHKLERKKEEFLNKFANHADGIELAHPLKDKVHAGRDKTSQSAGKPVPI